MQSRDELKQDERRLYSWIGIAAAAHVAVIAVVVVLQLLYVRMHPPLKIVSVSLMQMPGLPGPAGGPKSAEAPVADVEKQPEASEPAGAKKVAAPPPQPAKKSPEPTAVKKIPEKPPLKAPLKTPVKAPEPTPKKQSAADERKNLQAALERLKTNTAARKTETGKTSASASAPSNLSSTLASLQKKVASGGGGGPARFGAGSGAGGGRYGSGGGGAFDPYMAQIAGIIQNNWSFSSQMVRITTGMEVYVSLLILPDGSVSQIRYDRKSSSEYLNNSVKVALAKSIPFPAQPREGGSKGRWVGFVFTPDGIKP